MQLQNKKILVTGADGFIGSHLVEELISLNYSVRAFCMYNSFNSWGWLDTLPEDCKSKVDVVLGDIRDSSSLKPAMKEIDVVFHLAALIAIPFSYISPGSFINTNITGTLNILECARDEHVERILVTSTSEVYGSAQYTPIDELHPLQGQSPYSATKIGADKIAESFFKSFSLPVTVARPFNTFGPRQSARAIIPTVITQLLAGSREIRLGSLYPRRDFNYVKDVCNAFISIAAADEAVGKEINIASGESISIEEVAKKVIGYINPDANIIYDQKRIRPRLSEVDCLIGSNTKLQKLTGWKQQYTFDEGLKNTINWFKTFQSQYNYKAHIYNV